jgi:Ca-activated chloride channel family protein
MTLLAPSRLWILGVIPALAVLYVWLQMRRRHRAVRFTNIELLRSVAPSRPGWRRHVPAGLLAVAMAGLIVGMAKPTAPTRVPKKVASIMLAIDISNSMAATDVAPTRLTAAKAAAADFVGNLPPQVLVGLVAFDRQATVLSTPTADHAAVAAAIGSLSLGPGTAAGDAISASLAALAGSQPAAAPGAVANGAAGKGSSGNGGAIVLLSDGVTTTGTSVVDAALAAAAQHVPVSTIAFGTSTGSVTVRGQIVPVPADPATMAQVAELTSGRAFEAVSQGELRKIYKDIGTRVGYETKQREVSGAVIAVAATALLTSLGLALVWNGRIV